MDFSKMPAIGHDELLENSIHRHPDLEPMDFVDCPLLSEDDLTGDVGIIPSHRNKDGIIAQLPEGPVPFPAQSLKPPKPDISLGLGKRKANIDIGRLCAFLLDICQFCVHRKTLYVFDGPCWRKLEENDADSYIFNVLQRNDLAYCLGTREIREIRQRLMLVAEIQHPGEFAPPENCMNFLDGTLDLLTGRLTPHSPKDEFTFAIPCLYKDVRQSVQDGEVFEDFINAVSGGSPVVRRQLLELTAIALTGIELKYFYVLLGPSHTGKTQYGRFLEELIGSDQVASVRDIKDFSERFTVGEIAGKRLVTCLDLPDAPLPPLAVGKIKQLVGDDSVKGELKYQRSFTFSRKPLLLFAGNHPIRLPNADSETAFLNRMVIIPFSCPCEEQNMVHHLYRELLEEAPYIIHEAICAFEDLASRNYAVTRAEVPEMYQVEEGVQSIRYMQTFIAECCCADADAEIRTKDLWTAYQEFAENRGIPPASFIAFSRAFKNALQSMAPEVIPVKRVCGYEERGFAGIRLKAQA